MFFSNIYSLLKMGLNKLIFHTYIMFFFCLINGQILIPNNKEDSTEICLQLILKNNTIFAANSILITENSLNKSFIHNKVKFIRTIPSVQQEDDQLIRMKLYVIILRQISIKRVLKYLKKTNSWNPRAKFIVTSETEGFNEIISEAVKYFVVNIIVLQLNDLGNVEIFLLNSNLEISLVGLCTEEVLDKTVLFPYKYTKDDWSNMTLRVYPLVIPPYVFFNNRTKKLEGLEIESLKVIQNKLGFKINYVQNNFTTWGHKNEGKYTDMYGVMDDLQNDLMIGMVPYNYCITWDFDTSFTYLADSSGWIVPSADLLSDWVIIARLYPGKVWLLILVSVILIPVINNVIAKFLKEREHKMFLNWDICQLMIISTIFGISVPLIPKSVSLRLLFTVWILNILILITIFQSKLMSAFTQPQYEDQISNNFELLQSDLKFGYHLNLKITFSGENKIDDRFLNEAVICDMTMLCMNRTAFKRDFAVVRSGLLTEYLRLEYYTNIDGTSLIYIFESKLFSYYSYAVFARGHPLYARFTQLTMYLFEGGFPKFWFMKIKATQRPKISGEEPLQALKMKQLRPPFYLLIVGLGLATVTFFVEIITNKIKTS